MPFVWFVSCSREDDGSGHWGWASWLGVDVAILGEFRFKKEERDGDGCDEWRCWIFSTYICLAVLSV